MDRIGLRTLRCLDDGVDAQIRLGRRRRSNVHGLVGRRDMQRRGVGIAEDRHRAQTHATARVHDTHGDLASIGD